MNAHTEELFDRVQTVGEIQRLARKYNSDLAKFRLHDGRALDKISLSEFYDFVRSIPYRHDTAPIEIVARPFYLIKHGPKIGIDCKKKCTLIISWCLKNNVPCRIITSSKRADKRHHHVFPQVEIAGKWVNADATYSNMRFGEEKVLTAWSVYNGC